MINHSALLVLHIGCVFASAGLFLLRYVLATLGVNWRQSIALRVMPHIVDTALLISAILLCVTLQQYPFVNGWLTVKVILLIVYIGLGTLTLSKNRTAKSRRVTFFLAAVVFVFIVSVARSHNPLGVLARFF
jgi:uncharacterized membrane protein SirB2